LNVDHEAELIRRQDWAGLKRHYSTQLDHAWELAWVQLVQFKDVEAAVHEFQKSIRDPNLEQASYLMLWKLGHRPKDHRAVGPASLRLYDAYMKGDFRQMHSYLRTHPDSHHFFSALLKSVYHGSLIPTFEDLKIVLGREDLEAEAHLFLGMILGAKLKKPIEAAEEIKRFYSDPWSVRAMDELRRSVLDEDLSKRVRFAYAHRDGITLKRLFKAIESKISKISEDTLSLSWRDAFMEAVRYDHKRITENLMGVEFWKDFEISPLALYGIKEQVFPLSDKLPSFVSEWKVFFETDEMFPPPFDSEPEALPLWQVAVEIDNNLLSEALLRFSTEERFLFLWSLKQKNLGEADGRRWPQHERESDVVRTNLRRAFERSSNKLLWFDRLRSCGCSQDFYEYVLTQLEIPIDWLLEDLRKNYLLNTASIRSYLKEHLSLMVPDSTGGRDLQPAQILEILSFLTPAEGQQVLLSRYLLSDLPREILTDDNLDLFWDARDRVGEESFERWIRAALEYIGDLDRRQLQSRHWLWIREGWALDSKYLEQFSPSAGGDANFPWEDYLKQAHRHKKPNLVFLCLNHVRDQHLKTDWIGTLMEVSSDRQVLKLIDQLDSPYVQASLRAKWFEMRGEVDSALIELEAQREETPLLNEEVEIIRKIFELTARLPRERQQERAQNIDKLTDRLRSLGALELEDLSNLRKSSESLGDLGRSWNLGVHEWWASSEIQKLNKLDSLMDLAFRHQGIEEAQKLLVDYFFQSSRADELGAKILDYLVSEESVFRLKHFRREFIERASKVFPLNTQILRKRSEYDYRAVLLWDCFYSDALGEACAPQEVRRPKFTPLWGLTELMSSPDSFKIFSHYLLTMPKEETTSDTHEFVPEAERILSRSQKIFGLRQKIRILLDAKLSTPLKLQFEPACIFIKSEFFNELDEDLWRAICAGFFQILQDRDRGLYDEAALMERFFQGCLLSGAPLQKIIRFCVWLAVSEGLVEARLLKQKPEVFMKELPFLNSLIIFYLGNDFSRRILDGSIILT